MIKFTDPIIIDRIDVLTREGHCFVRTRSKDGAEGLAITNARAEMLMPLLQKAVIPFFLDKDARDLESLVDEVFVHASNYKYAGIAFWNPVAYVEHSLLDMLGKIAGVSVGNLLGEVYRTEIPVYVSSTRRDTTPEEEVAWVGERVAATGARAVKMKVGGRMSKNADAMPGRSTQLTALARRSFGDDMVIYMDANGSYDAEAAIAVGHMLASYGVAFFEEPCPFEWYEATKAVADALDLPVAGGEQDSSAYHFQRMIHDRIVDIVQPDLYYNGGFIRTLRVAAWAREAGMDATPHSPRADPVLVPTLIYASMVRNCGPFQEFGASIVEQPDWYMPRIEVHDGVIAVPDGPGLGMTYDPDFIAGAVLVKDA